MIKTAGIFFCFIVSIVHAQQKAPAYPLITHDPYFSIWSMSDKLNESTTKHWTNAEQSLIGIVKVDAKLRKLNPVIKGEDAGIVQFEFENGTQVVWDASRYNESNSDNPHYTFGKMLIEGSNGSIRLYNNGNITIQTLGSSERVHAYHHQNINFAGDCVYHIQLHFADCILNDKPFETNGADCLTNIKLQEAVYESAKKGSVIQIKIQM